MERSRTKLVCTIGPASAERVGELVAAGMDVARINFSHGTPDDHKAYVHAVRAAAHSARRSVAVMADLPGPKIRLGRLRDDVVELETGATFTLRSAVATSRTAAAETSRADGDVAVVGEGAAEAQAVPDESTGSGEAPDSTDVAGHGEPTQGATDASVRPADSTELAADAAEAAIEEPAGPAEVAEDSAGSADQTSASADLTEGVADAAVAPAGASELAADEAEASVDETEAPADALEAPADALEAPADAAEAPADAAEAPADALEAPRADDATDAPAEVPEAADVVEEDIGDRSGASVSTSGLAAQLQVGDRILLADGAAELRVTGLSGSEVQTEVVHGGRVRSRSGVNIPSSRLTGDGLTDDDRAAVPRALELRVDLIAQSFVRNADDVRALKQLLPNDGPRVVAKIETQAAVDAFDDIARVADGIMVARGDLGVDIPFEQVPLVQKDLITRSRAADRFTIVATQMLESMTAAARPTRAEVSDVANAVLDDADAVMLSAETAIGQFPVEALQAMARICVAAEHERVGDYRPRLDGPVTPATATIMAATAATGWTDVGAIWCFTRSGHTAEKLSMTRPRVPIVAFTLSPIVARRLAVRRGVIPMILPTNAGRGEPLINRMEQAWRAQRDHQEYESVVLVTTSSQPAGINRLEVHQLTRGRH